MTVLAVVACGTGAKSEVVTLASWRDSVCSIVESKAKAVEAAEPAIGKNEPPSFSPEKTRRQIQAMRDLVAELREVPLPASHPAEAARFLDMQAVAADRYEKAMPRIEAASRRLERVAMSIDPDADLPPAPEGTTVAGGIMAQMMSIPGLSDAYTDLIAAYAETWPDADEDKEADRLAKTLDLDQCDEPEEREDRPSAAELTRCGARGAPVTLQTLVDVFRANDISLEIQEDTCSISEQARIDGARPDATNAGPSGLSQPDGVELEEGFILCDVGNESRGKELLVNKWDTDTETTLTTLNISCTIYPHSTSTEVRQIARVRKAMEAVAAGTP